MSEEVNDVNGGTVVEQNEASNTTVIEGNDPAFDVTNTAPGEEEKVDTNVPENVVRTPLTPLEREMYLLELNAISSMMGAQFEKPDMRNHGEGKPQSWKGTYTTVNIYDLKEIIALRERADELCGLLGINLTMKQQ